ncbi:MAG: hypothetical protein B7X41_07300, partial [Microbacterium sp. 14-71-5]
VNGLMHGADAGADPVRFRGAVTAGFVGVAAVAVVTTIAALAMPRNRADVPVRGGEESAAAA